MNELPDLFFRIRENGAAVFRRNPEDRLGSFEMEQIAVINTRRGDFRPHGDAALSKEDEAAITSWIAARLVALEERQLDDIQRLIEQLHMAAHWAQGKAEDEALDEVTDPLLMAMHDLRSVLVKRKTDGLGKADG